MKFLCKHSEVQLCLSSVFWLEDFEVQDQIHVWKFYTCKGLDIPASKSYLISKCSISPLKLWVWVHLMWGVLDATLCDKVCQWLATGQWFLPGTPVSSTNKTDCHDITEILLKVALNTITHNPKSSKILYIKCEAYHTNVIENDANSLQCEQQLR